MSMYNLIIFGRNPFADVILATIGLTRGDVGRFRDAFVSEGKVAVYTRNGGGNRECRDDEECEGCVGCFMRDEVQTLDHYLYDEDDQFDSTYATIYFEFPPEHKRLLESLDSGKPFDPDKAWFEALEKLRQGSAPEIEEKLKPIVEQIAGALKGDR